MRSFFFLGTEPSCGASLVAVLFARALSLRKLQVGVMKPVETGCSLAAGAAEIRVGGTELVADRETLESFQRLSDLAGPPPPTHLSEVGPEALQATQSSRLREATGRAGDLPLDLVNPYRFAPSLEPLVASRMGQVEIDLDHILDCHERLCARSRVMVIDGCFGLMTPLADGQLQCDLIARMDASVVLVCPSRVGSIGQCLLHVELLQKRGIPLCGIVINRIFSTPVQPEEAANPLFIEQYSDAEVRGVLPYFEEQKLLDLDHLASRLEVHVDLDGMIGAPLKPRLTTNS